jgi:hypothetical protein
VYNNNSNNSGVAENTIQAEKSIIDPWSLDPCFNKQEEAKQEVKQDENHNMFDDMISTMKPFSSIKQADHFQTI